MDETRDQDRTSRANARAVMGIFLLAFLALAVFRSATFVSYTYDLPESAATGVLVRAAERWNGWMEGLGAVAFSQRIVDLVDQATWVRFGDVEDEATSPQESDPAEAPGEEPAPADE